VHQFLWIKVAGSWRWSFTSILEIIYHLDIIARTEHPTDLFNQRRRYYGRSRCPCSLRHGSAAARLLELQVRILPEAWMSVSCVSCVLCR
jgi:hypothetical protein